MKFWSSADVMLHVGSVVCERLEISGTRMTEPSTCVVYLLKVANPILFGKGSSIAPCEHLREGVNWWVIKVKVNSNVINSAPDSCSL